jgi:hypothetical protein
MRSAGCGASPDGSTCFQGRTPVTCVMVTSRAGAGLTGRASWRSRTDARRGISPAKDILER